MPSAKQLMLAGEPYLADDPALVADRDLPGRHLCFGNPCRPVRQI